MYDIKQQKPTKAKLEDEQKHLKTISAGSLDI